MANAATLVQAVCKARNSSVRPTSALLAVGIVPAALALPVVTTSAPEPGPVAPAVRSMPLRGVDSSALPSGGASRAAVRPKVLTPQQRTERFDLVAVTWDEGSAAAGTTVKVRVREDGGWTGWQALEAEEDGPDPGSADARAQDGSGREGSQTLLTAGADGLQVRVDGARTPQGLRAELVDGGRSDADATVGQARRAASTAAADTTAPRIITRAEWGADESLRRSTSYTGTAKVGFVHHTASTNNYSPEQAAAQIRAIYAYHTKVNRWSDIGYNYLVDKYGTIYEGRAGGIDRDVLGAHTGGFNTNTFAVSQLGNFSTTAAPDPMVESVAQVLAWRLKIAHRDPAGVAQLVSAGGGTSKYRAGVRVQLPAVAGHRDVGATACPGSNLWARMDEIRARVLALTGPSIWDPALAPTTLWPAPDGRAHAGEVSLTARTSEPQAWTLQILDPAGAVVFTQAGATTPESLDVAVTWDRRVAGQLALPGEYAVVLSSASTLGAVHSFTSTITVRAPAAAPVPVPPAAPAPVLQDPPHIAVVYTSDGERDRGGRQWSTTCRDYGTTHRCAASTVSSHIKRVAPGRYTRVTGMRIATYGYTVPFTPAWDKSPWLTEGEPTLNGRQWRIDCTEPTGPRICKVWMKSSYLVKATVRGKVRYVSRPVEQLSRIYRTTVSS